MPGKGSGRSVGFAGLAVVVIVAASLLTWMIVRGSFGQREPAPGHASDDATMTSTPGPGSTASATPGTFQLRAVLLSASLTDSASFTAAGTPAASPTSASDLAWIDPPIAAEFAALRACAEPAEPDPARPLIACRDSEKFVLGPAEVSGDAVASAQARQAESDRWVVEVSLKPDAARALATVTTRLASLQTSRNSLAVLAGGRLIAVAQVMEPITAGVVQLAGNYTRAQAQALAAALNTH